MALTAGPLFEALGKNITAVWAEALASQLADPRQAVEFRVSGLVEPSFGAEFRLLGLLARRIGDGQLTVMRLGDRRLASGVFSARTSELVTENLAGFILARLAGRVTDSSGADVTEAVRELQREAMDARGGALVSGQMRVYPLIDEYPSVRKSKFASAFDGRSDGAFRRQLLGELQEMGLSAPSGFSELVKFLVEALENTTKHGMTDLSKARIPGVRYLSIRRRWFADLNNADLAAPAAANLADYVQRMTDKYGAAHLRTRPLVEFVVADCGVGIAARKSTDQLIQTRPFPTERTAFDGALHTSEHATPGGWEGFGLFKMQIATRQLDAFLTIRSGRVLATRHHLDPSDDADQLAMRIEPKAQPPLGGTALSVLVPWVDTEPTLFGQS